MYIIALLYAYSATDVRPTEALSCLGDDIPHTYAPVYCPPPAAQTSLCAADRQARQCVVRGLRLSYCKFKGVRRTKYGREVILTT